MYVHNTLLVFIFIYIYKGTKSLAKLHES